MPYSKFSDDLEFDENQWVVSLINTQTGISNVFGGHVKIVIEGVKRKNNIDHSHLFNTELFVGEYHIMEANRTLTESWIPQAFRNTQSNYLVLITERNDYSARQEQQYEKVSARCAGGINPADVIRMIQTIKREKTDIESEAKEGNFQYAGQWCCYSYGGGHNCTTWAETMLDIIGLGKHLTTDSSKASPVLHVNSFDNRKPRCVIL